MSVLVTPGQALANKPVRRIPDALIEPGPGKNRHILVVDKSQQRLFLYEFKKGNYYLLRSFMATTGENRGDKLKEGDRKTPEGFYIFNKKSIMSELAPIYGVLAYPMDYPNFWDVRLGKKGKGIWMHGLDRKLVPRDTNGCVALNNIDIMSLDEYVRLYETPIVVYKKIKYKDLDEINREAARVKAFVERWRKAWESKDSSLYRSLYTRDFTSSDGKDYQAWLAHKNRLNRLYTSIRVKLNRLRIFRHKGIVVVVFNQYYRGGKRFVSDGVKRLYLRESKGQYKIAAEVWRPFPPKPPRKLLPAEVRERVLAEARAAAATASAKKVRPAPATRVAAETGPASEEVRRMVDRWLSSWQRKDIEGYLSYYHPEFRFKNMDLEGFKAYKKRLARTYRKISITAKRIKIKVEGPQAHVTFIQRYRTDQYRDYGLKTLVLRKHKQDWRIREESWENMSAGAKP